MDHFEEHILELYVLDAGTIKGQREDIERHLALCAGCNSVVNDLKSFYATTDADFEALRSQGLPDKRSLVRPRALVKRYGDDLGSPVPVVDSVPMNRLKYFVYRHPIVAGSSVFAFGAGVVLTLSLLFRQGPADTNPNDLFYNTEQGRVEILNKEHQKLWDFPSLNLTARAFEAANAGVVQTLVKDLNHDGHKEVLTVLPMGNEDGSRRILRVFDGRGALLFTTTFDRHFQYLNRTYTPEFCADGLVVTDLSSEEHPNILLTIGHRDRSPSYLIRLDAIGREIGSLWHFGHLGPPFEVDLDKNGKPEIIIIGINDTPDTLRPKAPSEFPVFAVVDPAKIVGQKKSVCSPGFQMPPSDAEIYYVRLPFSDMNYLEGLEGFVRGMKVQDENSIVLTVTSSNVLPDLPIQFDYIFNNDMTVREVKSTNTTDRLHAILTEQGKLAKALDREYLENLRRGVRYWDGKEWRAEVIKVNHDQPITEGLTK
jgi:hypothetical protein